MGHIIGYAMLASVFIALFIFSVLYVRSERDPSVFVYQP